MPHYIGMLVLIEDLQERVFLSMSGAVGNRDDDHVATNDGHSCCPYTAHVAHRSGVLHDVRVAVRLLLRIHNRGHHVPDPQDLLRVLQRVLLGADFGGLPFPGLGIDARDDPPDRHVLHPNERSAPHLETSVRPGALRDDLCEPDQVEVRQAENDTIDSGEKRSPSDLLSRLFVCDL